ncbi:uncharacterized protein [Venturia canescens]|uniref:uncharacterized protein isoform X2 n=1 Tax=Venturia canescens TaxID=32260 RepID=UPI001C9CBAC3|nr:uncharacterized protein LOC122415576 isoform X2 [Venturia canescens]
MESTTVEVNGGNAEVARDEPNLENVETPMNETTNNDSLDGNNTNTLTSIKMEETPTEVNGDVKTTKKKLTPGAKRKLRKIKANSTGNSDTDVKPHTRGQKRKVSEPDDLSSEDSAEFNGFDTKVLDSTEPGSHVLQKLIAEAESADQTLILQTKRLRRSTAKALANMKSEVKDEDMDLDESKDDISNRVKKEKESDTDSIGIPNSVDSETDPLKTEESSLKSANSSANSSPSGIRPKLKIGKIVRNMSPAGGAKSKVVDMSNPLFREPFKYGWKRELVFRAGSDQHTVRRMADIYYYTPKGKKVRSFREVAEFLHTKELTIDNFTFFKEPLGVNNPDFEIIRDARVRDSTGYTPTPPRRSLPAKKSLTKRIVEKPLTPPLPAKPAAKSPKVTPAAIKVKLPGKKGQAKKVKSPAKRAPEPPMLPPQWSSPAATRRSQPIVEKTPPAKLKRGPKAKLQEPCSIRCSSSMGLIPSLQCSLCLCLYHPECVGAPDISPTDEYVCKNCHEDSDKSPQPGAGSAPPPPALIPISMMSSQNAAKVQPSVVTSPKPTKTVKTESSKSEPRRLEKKRNLSRSPNVSPSAERKDTAWLHTGNEFLRGHDGTVPKPAQNIALMAGKRYIVVPKNNAMAVQPAITVRPDKIGDKAPTLLEVSHSDTTAENSRFSSRSINDDVKSNSMETETNEEAEVLTEIVETVGKIHETLEKDQELENLRLNLNTENNSSDSSEIYKSDKFVSENEEQKEEEDRKTHKEDVAQLINELTDESPIADETQLIPTETETPKEQLETANEQQIVEPEKVKDVQDEPHLEITESQINQENVDTAIDPENLLREIPTSRSDSLESNNFTTSAVCVQPSKKKKLAPLENDQRHFMVSVCAGYNALSRIFQYLKVQELLRAARVCRMWRDLAAHPNLWKTVRMKNSQVTDWDGLADSLKRHGTQHLDLRKMLVAGESDGIWKKFVTVIPRVTSLVKLELCRCPVMVVEEVIKSCPQLEVLSAMSIKCDTLNLESVGNLKSCQELRLKAISGMSLEGDLSPLQELTQLSHLSLTSVKDLGKKNIDILGSLINLETLELGECSDFPDKFGTSVLLKLEKLERLRLEKGQGTCCTFDILDGVSKLPTLNQLELVNFDVKNGFDKCLSNCKNIKRLLIIPTYISQSATSNNMVLRGVTELSNNLTHFVWGVTLELLRVTELFVDQCNQMSKQVTGDSIPVLKPVPCLKLIKDVEEDDATKGDDKAQPSLTNPQVDILPLPQLQKLLLTALPKTRVKILKIPFHATWRQSISDTTTQ